MRSAIVNRPSGPLVPNVCRSVPRAPTFTSGMGVPPRVMVPLISTPASSLMSIGLVVALTCTARADFAAKPSRRKPMSYIPSFRRIVNVPSLAVCTLSSSLLLRARLIIIRRIPTGPPPPCSAALATTFTPDSGLPLASVTRPVTAIPRGIVSTMPFFRSPAEILKVGLFAGGKPFLSASMTTSPSRVVATTKRPSGPLTAPRRPPKLKFMKF